MFEFMSKYRLILLGGFTIFAASYAIYKVPQMQVALLRERIEAAQPIELKDRVQLEQYYVDYANKARTTLAQIIGGMVLLGGLYFTWRNAKIAQDNAKTAQDALQVTEEGKLTDRFSKAVELLGSDKLDVRVGGIYALERIARDSQKDHWTVMEVLTAFIRENAKLSSQPQSQDLNLMNAINDPEGTASTTESKSSVIPNTDGIATDIQAALTVIGRRKWLGEEKPHQKLDLSDTYLVKANLIDAHLEGAFLNRANLKGATLYTTYLNKAFLNGAHLEGACLFDARLEGAYLINAHLEGARLCDARLNKALLIQARLEGADFGDDESAGFGEATGLSLEQMSGNFIDERTILPSYLEQHRAALQERLNREQLHAALQERLKVEQD